MTHMATYKIHEAKAHFSEIIEQAMLGEEVIIARGSRPVVRLLPVRAAEKRRVGSAKGQFTMSADFDQPLTDFDEYT
jgi:prevent-host-death family protein